MKIFGTNHCIVYPYFYDNGHDSKNINRHDWTVCQVPKDTFVFRFVIRRKCNILGNDINVELFE